MSFCTAVNCMDGRVQIPVICHLKKHFHADYVDTISEPGPSVILAKQTSLTAVKSIMDRLEISIHHHHSVGIAIVAHHDCAGNPVPKIEQISHLRQAAAFLKMSYPNMEIVCLWVNEKWQVEEVPLD